MKSQMPFETERTNKKSNPNANIRATLNDERQVAVALDRVGN